LICESIVCSGAKVIPSREILTLLDDIQQQQELIEIEIMLYLNIDSSIQDSIIIFATRLGVLQYN